MSCFVSGPLMADPVGFASDASWCGTDWGPEDLVAVEFVDEPSSFVDHQYTITHSTPVQPVRPFTSTHKVCLTLDAVNGINEVAQLMRFIVN